MLYVDDTGKGSAIQHMEYDRTLLEGASHPHLHFYEWEKKSITYGHFIDPWALVDKEKCDALDFAHAKRPTGGGLLFHYADFSFSLFLPATCLKISSNVLENYAEINSCVLRALDLENSALTPITTSTRPTFCMAALTKYDLVVNGYKIGGAAQRKTRTGLLHQASIFLSAPNWEEISSITSAEVATAMHKQSRFLTHDVFSQNIREKLKRSIIEAVTEWLQN